MATIVSNNFSRPDCTIVSPKELVSAVKSGNCAAVKEGQSRFNLLFTKNGGSMTPTNCETQKFQWGGIERQRERAEKAKKENSSITPLYRAFQVLDVNAAKENKSDAATKITLFHRSGVVYQKSVLELARDELGDITWGTDRAEKLNQIVSILTVSKKIE